MRDRFVDTTTALLDERPAHRRRAGRHLGRRVRTRRPRRHPDRVLNVGIREQLMIGVAGGLALTGLRPIVHSYATFLVDRAYEQIKLDLDHQGVGAVLVSVGASYDGSTAGRTHMSPGDVALLDTLDGWTVHVPGHAGRGGAAAARGRRPRRPRLHPAVHPAQRPAVPRGRPVADGDPAGQPGAPVVVAVGPMLDPVLHATAGLDVTVAYTHTPRPFDAAGLRALVTERRGAGRAVPGRHVGAAGGRGAGATYRTGCSPSAWAAPTCAATAARRTTRGGTAWTRPACAGRSALSWLAAGPARGRGSTAPRRRPSR